MTYLMRLLVKTAVCVAMLLSACKVYAVDVSSNPDCERLETRLKEIRASDSSDGKGLVWVSQGLRDCSAPGSAEYTSTYHNEARGWYQAGNYKRVLALADSMLFDPHARDSTQLSIVSEIAALAAERIGSERSQYWYQMAFRNEAGRSLEARVNLRRNAGLSALGRGKYDEAQKMTDEALSLLASSPTDDLAFQKARIHVMASGILLSRALDGHSSNLASGRQHLSKARRILKDESTVSVPTETITSWLQMLEVHEAAYTFQSGSPRRASQKLDRIAAELSSPTVSGALFFLHEVGARIEMHRGHYQEALRHLDQAELLCSRPQWKFLLPLILRLRVETATKMQDTQLVLSTLRHLRDLEGVAAENNYRAASILALEYLPNEDAPWWPWVMVVGVVVGVAGYVHAQHSTYVLDQLLTPLNAGSFIPLPTPSDSDATDDGEPSSASDATASNETDAAPDRSIAEASQPSSSSDSPGDSSRGSSGDSSGDASAGPSDSAGAAQERRRSRLNVYGPHGGMLGTMPVPRLLRRDAQSHYVGIEMGDRILIVEQFSAASNDVVQRTDGGGFERFELPFKISGVVVASIARSSGSSGPSGSPGAAPDSV